MDIEENIKEEGEGGTGNGGRGRENGPRKNTAEPHSAPLTAFLPRCIYVIPEVQKDWRSADKNHNQRGQGGHDQETQPKRGDGGRRNQTNAWRVVGY